MSRRYSSKGTLNEQEQSSSSLRIPESITATATTNTMTRTSIGFTPVGNSVPPVVFSALNNPFSLISGTDTSSRLSTSNTSDNRNFLFSTDRFNQSLLQPNISPYAGIINNDSRFHPSPPTFPNPFRPYNSIGVNASGTTFDRFLQSLPVSQGNSPLSVPAINVASVTPTGHTSSLYSMATTSNTDSLNIPPIPPILPMPSLLNDPYRYLLSFEEQAKLAHEAAMHYANLTERLMQHARNAAAADNMPLPPLPEAVFSMVQKYEQQKNSPENSQQQQRQQQWKLEEDDKKDQQATTTYITLSNMVPFPHSDGITVTDRGTSDQQQIAVGSLRQDQSLTPSLFAIPVSETVLKVQQADNVSTTSRSESNSSNKTATAEVLPILSPHPYCSAATENNIVEQQQQQQQDVEMEESQRKKVAETVANSFLIQ